MWALDKQPLSGAFLCDIEDHLGTHTWVILKKEGVYTPVGQTFDQELEDNSSAFFLSLELSWVAMVTMASPWYPHLTLSLPHSHFSAVFLLGNALPNKVVLQTFDSDSVYWGTQERHTCNVSTPLSMNMSCSKFSEIAYNSAEVTILGHTSWCTCVCFSRMFLAQNCRIIGYPLLQFCQILPS